MRMMIATALAISLPVVGMAADDPIAQAVKARQGYFTMMGANMGTLAGMAQGKIDYDADAAARAASNIEALTMYNAAIHFPEGSSSDDLGSDVTEAKANIWTDLEGFQAKYVDLQDAAMGAGELVAGGPESLGPVVGALGGACKACHDTYRVK
ncbi:MAG: cytochrome C [Rhodobacterales bacterium]|nr:MAG: cytochrome C [Rhodobacterales bacterium]